MRIQYLLSACLFLSVMAACKQREPSNFQGIAKQKSTSPAITLDDVAYKAEEAPVAAVEAPAPPPPDAVKIPVKITRNADIQFSVTDLAKSKSLIAKAVADSKGYIASESESKTDNEWSNRVVLRVPADKFDECLAALAGQAKRLDRKNITAEDMTEEYVDLAARMKARKEVEQRYIQILQKANKVEDILAVEEQLKSIREEVEAAQGRLQYIDQRVAMSTINLHYYQYFSNTEQQTSGFFSHVGAALGEGWNSALGFVLGVISVWPFWLVIAVLFFVGRKVFRKYRRRKLATS